MAKWAARKKLARVGDLVRLSPSDLLAERKLFHSTIVQTRALIESFLGRPWEDFVAKPSEREPTTHWDALRERLTVDERAFRLGDLPIPSGIRRFAVRGRLTTLGELARHSETDLVVAPGLGQRTVDKLTRVLTEHLTELSSDTTAEKGLLECVHAATKRLDPKLRFVVERRSGLRRDALPLQQLGDELGMSGERVRQLESKACRKLSRGVWVPAVRRRIDDALAQGSVTLSELASDPWWAAATARPAAIAFVLERILQSGVRVIDFDDQPWLSRFRAADIDEARAEIGARARAVPLPAPLKTFSSLVTTVAEKLGGRVALRLTSELEQGLLLDKTRNRVLAFGDTRAAELLALLRAAPEPLHVDEAYGRLGVRLGTMPEEVIHFARGHIGLRQHFPHFEIWQRRLAPDATRLVRHLGPERHWICGELLDKLRDRHEIPDWLTAHGLAALIKAEGSLCYLGRLRVALPGMAKVERRVFAHEALEKLLREAGAPVSQAALLEQLRARIGVSACTPRMLFHHAPFVSVDTDRIGLLARDVPGGDGAVAQARDHVAALLSRRERGLSTYHVHQEVKRLSRQHASWSDLLTVSVLRSDDRFRHAMSGSIGLSNWESTRVPTRLELLRAALEEGGGRVTVEALNARIRAHYGEAHRPSLVSFARQSGASIRGDWIERRRR
jgi:hypothetical protein